MKVIIAIILILFSASSFSQKDDVWRRFYNNDRSLIGFKDKKGIIKIAPKFTSFISADRFKDIMAVKEENSADCYLLKNGRKIGKDSLYSFDMTFDCESEGFIRFEADEKMGMFNRRGTVAIPAEYNGISQMKNGLAIGLKGATKKYWDQEKHSGCNHWSWNGGTQYLIDSNNRILVENFKFDGSIDFHSLTVENQPSPDTCRENFKGVNDKYYTFTNNLKSFKRWLFSDLLKSISKQKLFKQSYPQIIFWNKNSGWASKKKVDFLNTNYKLIVKKISEIKNVSSEYFISLSDVITAPDNLESKFEKYQNNCGDLNTSHYPLMSVVVNHKKGEDSSQDQFDFLKTENGFKLLSVTIRNRGEIK